jgi:hypothetical protein
MRRRSVHSEYPVSEEYVVEGDDVEQRNTIIGRLLRSVGFANGLASKHIVSYASMQLAMQADEGFTAQETKQAEQLYKIDLSTWPAGDVKMKVLTNQLRAILQGTEKMLDRMQLRCGQKNESRWQLISV